MNKVKVITDYGPDTAEEVAIKIQLSAMENAWSEMAKPLIDRLVEIRARKMPKVFLVPDDAS